MMQAEQKSQEKSQESFPSFRDLMSESEISARELENHIDEKVRAKTLEILASLGKQDLVPEAASQDLSKSLPSSFMRLSPREQDKKIQQCLDNKTSYGKTLKEFKGMVIEKLEDPMVKTTKPVIQAVAGEVVKLAQREDITLFKLYFSAINCCQVAADKKGFFETLCKPIAELSDALTREGSHFNLSVFLSNWEGDAFKLSVKEIAEENDVVENSVLKATTMVFKEENDFLNQSMIKLNQTLKLLLLTPHPLIQIKHKFNL